MAESAQEMQIVMKSLLDTGENADLTLVCRNKVWKVHSSYFWPRSSWFKAACKGGFNEGEIQRIELPEEEPSMVYRMLQHLYMQTYTVNLYHDPFWCSNDSWAMTRLHVHAQMYSLGDKYDISSLKKEATQRFTKDVHIPGDKKSETLTLLSVVDLIYTSTPDSDRGLRNLLVRQIYQRYATASKHFVDDLDTALQVRQFARDSIVLHGKRSIINYADLANLAESVYRIWLSHVRPLLVAMIAALPPVATIGNGMVVTSVWLCWIIFVFVLTIIVTILLIQQTEIIFNYQLKALGRSPLSLPSILVEHDYK